MVNQPREQILKKIPNSNFAKKKKKGEKERKKVFSKKGP